MHVTGLLFKVGTDLFQYGTVVVAAGAPPSHAFGKRAVAVGLPRQGHSLQTNGGSTDNVLRAAVKHEVA
jgi:hypothetical protein